MTFVGKCVYNVYNVMIKSKLLKCENAWTLGLIMIE